MASCNQSSFTHSDEEYYPYLNDTDDDLTIYFILYMNDILLSGWHSGELAELKQQLRLKFAMKDLGPVHHILGMKITLDRISRWLWLSQSDYIQGILDLFNQATAKPATTLLPTNLHSVTARHKARKGIIWIQYRMHRQLALWSTLWLGRGQT